MPSPDIHTEFDTFARVANEVPSGTRVPVEVRITASDPFDAYRRARNGPGGFYLETTGGQDGWGYFGIDPIKRIQVSADAVSIQNHSPSLAAIDGAIERERLVRGGCNVPYPCGVFGWISYDIARELEELPEGTRNERRLPRLQLGVFDRVVAWEEPHDDDVTLRITACPTVEDNVEETYERGLASALELAREITAGTTGTSAPPQAPETAEFESECGRDRFSDRVEAVKRYIRDGDTFQANVSHRLTAPAAVHPVQAYAALRDVNPAPYSALLEYPGIDLVSASPELLLDVTNDRLLTEPIAGTRPRGETPAEDDEFEADLRSNDKERAEHAMLVDLERNDLGKVCEYGTVDVSEYRRVDRYSEVMHLVSLVEGQLRSNTSIAGAIGAVFPGGTITGAPKPRTMEIIDEVESTRRGPYTGSIVALGFDGRATLNIIIRTLVRYEDEYHLRVGAGVVHDSEPESEYDETLDKAAALITAVDSALGDRASFAVETSTDKLEGTQ